jgi:single-stranded DNA-binding protein
MAPGFNHAVLLGKLAAAPEQFTTRNGKAFLKAVLTVSTYRKTVEDVSEEHVVSVPVTLFGKTAEVFGKYVLPGDVVHLAGHLDSYGFTDDQGKKRYSLSFVGDQLTLLPSNRKELSPQQTERRPF